MKNLFILCMTVLFSTASVAGEKVELTPDRTIVLGGIIDNNLLGPMMSTLDSLSKTGKDIDIIISSPGGSVIVGSLVIDKMEQLKNSGINFRCFVRDVAASMAFQILLHCNERYAAPHSFLLWHPVRVFMQGVLTGALATQLQQADEVALHDLRAYLPMSEVEMLMHFQNETLHQALNLQYTAPGFFKAVTNKVSNLYPEKPALDTTSLGNFFGLNQIVYIHERFVTRSK